MHAYSWHQQSSYLAEGYSLTYADPAFLLHAYAQPDHSQSTHLSGLTPTVVSIIIFPIRHGDLRKISCSVMANSDDQEWIQERAYAL